MGSGPASLPVMAMAPRPIIFLDLDGVLVLNRGVGFDKHQLGALDPEICRRLIHPPAGQTLTELLNEVPAHVVVTSNWVRFTSRTALVRLLCLAGYEAVAAALHDAWSAPRKSGASRVGVIEDWLSEHHRAEPYCVIDDPDSGSDLAGSIHAQAGRVLLCSPGTGLHRGHLPFLRAALLPPP